MIDLKKFQKSNGKSYLRNKSTAIAVFVAVITCLFVFFFISPYIFVKSADDMLYTEIGKEIDIGSGHTVTIDSWQYSEKENEMEVVLSLNNTSFDGIDTYNYSALSRDNGNNTQNLKTEILYESSFFSVVKISQLKSFTEVRLTVSYETSPLLSGNDKENQTNYAALFTNIKKVEKTDGFTQKDIITLYKDKLQNQINEINLEIAEANSQISEYQKIQENILEKVAEIRDNQQYMTETELAGSESQIQSYEKSYNDYSTQIEGLEAQISDYNEEIAERQDKQKELDNLRK